jgi:hypothetical protein
MSNNQQCLSGAISFDALSVFNFPNTQKQSNVSVDLDSYRIVMEKKEEKPIDIVVSKRISTFKLISFLSFAFIFSLGVLDILFFIFSGHYYFHPYFALIITTFSGFLLATTILHSIGY